MTDIFSNIKTKVCEPKIYSLLVTSAKGAQVLYLGIHFSLEDAYQAARAKAETQANHGPADAIDINLWNILTARQAIAQFVGQTEPLVAEGKNAPLIDPQVQSGEKIMAGDYDSLPQSVKDLLNNPNNEFNATEEKEKTIDTYAEDMRNSKNDLMKKLIEQGNTEEVEKVKGLLGPHSRSYVLKAIKEKSTSPTPIQEDKNII